MRGGSDGPPRPGSAARPAPARRRAPCRHRNRSCAAASRPGPRCRRRWSHTRCVPGRRRRTTVGRIRSPRPERRRRCPRRPRRNARRGRTPRPGGRCRHRWRRAPPRSAPEPAGRPRTSPGPADSAAGGPARCARAPRRRLSRVPCLVNSHIVAVSHLAWRTSSDEHDLPHRHLPLDDIRCQQGWPVTALQLAGEALHRRAPSSPARAASPAGVAPGATARPDRPELPSATSILGIR